VARLKLSLAFDVFELVQLTYDPTQHVEYGSFENARALGLNSCDGAVVDLLQANQGDTSMIGFDMLNVCLPKIMTSTDTVIIETETMKIRDDLDVSLLFFNDYTGGGLYMPDAIDSAGYKYRSFWEANSNLIKPEKKEHFYRFYPSESENLWWDEQTQNGLTTFLSEELYVVGGSLSVDCVGALSPIQDIDNRFWVTTDTIFNNEITQTKVIIVDGDPSNQIFVDFLGSDRLRGIAWREGAGTMKYPPHPARQVHLNHYWDDTATPCENGFDVDSGIMQIYRTANTWSWQKHFSVPNSKPDGYYQVTWDSLMWNWKINITNGIYIHDDYYPAKFNEPQKNFPDSCAFVDCGTFPKKKNKADLRSYGYHAGEQDMGKIKTDDDWNEIICDIMPPIREDAKYVQLVRKYKYERPWE